MNPVEIVERDVWQIETLVHDLAERKGAITPGDAESMARAADELKALAAAALETGNANS